MRKTDRMGPRKWAAVVYCIVAVAAGVVISIRFSSGSGRGDGIAERPDADAAVAEPAPALGVGPPADLGSASAAGPDAESALPSPAEEGSAPDRAVLRVPGVAATAAADPEKLAKWDAAGVFRFADPVRVEVSSDTAGRWESGPEGESIWRLLIESEDARSLNLGFSRYRMPPGGRLYVYPPGRRGLLRPFTERDQDDHGQLWTPVIPGDRIILELVLPPRSPPAELELAYVNRGFRHLADATKIGGNTSGSCNIDVVCDAATLPRVGSYIDLYRDQIRAVAAFTLNGIDVCSGVLLNNTAQDARPYFLTADHCGITSANAPSMVLYWNYENSTCRQPGTFASGGVGDGSLVQFNSGAQFLAEYEPSDMTLVELDDPVDPTYQVYYAGWNRSSDGISGGAVGIHHPGVAEKRISFEYDDVSTTAYSGTTSPGDGTHIRVEDWDEGTTEPGSSGSALFDPDGLVIGQLHGGGAGCGNNLSDWYGRLAMSWEGGGAPESQLRYWLDPLETGVSALPGMNGDELLRVGDVETMEGDSGSHYVEFTVWLEPAATELVTVTATTEDAAATAPEDYIAIAGTLLTFLPGQTSQVVQVEILGDLEPEEHETFHLRLSDPAGAVLGRTLGVCTILNDDYIPPIITGSLSVEALQGRAFQYQLTALNTPTLYGFSGPVPPGMSIHPTTGLLDWTPSDFGPVQVDLVASNPAGSDTNTLAIEVLESSLANAIDQPGLAYEEGLIPWVLDTDVTHDGEDAARSGPIQDGQSSWFEFTLSGPDTVVYWWKVSSEPGYDHLRLTRNGNEWAAISGDLDWDRVVMEVPAGAQTLRWSYNKDGSFSDGADAGWVDELKVASSHPEPVITSPIRAAAMVGVPFAYQMEATASPTGFAAHGLPEGLAIDAVGLISGVPEIPIVHEIELEATNDFGTGTERLRLIVTIPVGPALDAEALSWSVGGNAPWFGQSEVTYDGLDAASSGRVGHGGRSWMETKVIGPDILEFRWSVSSEDRYDFLRFLLDDEVVASMSGSVGWQRQIVHLPAGVHFLRWDYVKDGSVSVGRDAGFVDQVRLASISPAPIVLGPSVMHGIQGERLSYRIAASGSPTWYSVDPLPEGFVLRPNGLLTGQPAAEGDYPVVLQAGNDAGNGELEAVIRVVPELPLANALDSAGLIWIGDGGTDWYAQSLETHDGVDAARSGNIGHGESSWLHLPVTGPGAIDFWWMVSSEAPFDLLNFEIDGIVRESISGESGWQRVQAVIPDGSHLLSWGYTKDGSDSAGLDAGFLDQIVVSGYIGWVAAKGLGLDADPLSDPDGDRRSHGWEYLIGAYPSVAEVHHPHDLTVLAPPTDAMSFTFGAVMRNDPAFAYEPETSTNLEEWSSQDVEEVTPVDQTDVPAGFTRRAFRGSTPPPPSQQGRIRLHPADR